MTIKVPVKTLISRIHANISDNYKLHNLNTTIEPKNDRVIFKHNFVISHADAAAILDKDKADHRDTDLVERHFLNEFKGFAKNVHVTTGEHSFNVTMTTSHPFDSFTDSDAARLEEIDAYAKLIRNIRDKSIEPENPLYRFFTPVMFTQKNITIPHVKLDQARGGRFEMTVAITNKESEFEDNPNLKKLKERVKANLAARNLDGEVKIEKFIRNEPSNPGKDTLRVLVTYPCEQRLLKAVAPFSQIKSHLAHFSDANCKVSVAEIDHWMK